MKLAKLGTNPEIFHTIQGEGPCIGSPAVFIRASQCNLHCIWCDTDYTWNFAGSPWPHQNDTTPGYTKFNPSEVSIDLEPAAAARTILAFNCPHVVITGGEPLLQQSAFLEMLNLIRSQQPDCFCEVETNATRIPTQEFTNAVNQFNVSPKLANSGMTESLRLQPDALRFFAASPKAWFKFVVANPSDLEEILSLRARFAIPHHRILLMPEGRTPTDLDRSAPWLAELCRNLNFRFCDRLHIRLWGNRRGV